MKLQYYVISVAETHNRKGDTCVFTENHYNSVIDLNSLCVPKWTFPGPELYCMIRLGLMAENSLE